MKREIMAVLGLIGAIWILCPLPEISIVVGYITGKSLTVMFGLPWYCTWIGVGLSVPAGWIVLNKVGLLDKIGESIGPREDIYVVLDRFNERG